jgi:uncharacterized membrane protein YdcZ (DUF606 family)
MAAFSAALLLFSGQALCGVLIDFIAEGAFDARKLIGTLILLAGLAINALLTKRSGSDDGAGAGTAAGSGLEASRQAVP